MKIGGPATLKHKQSNTLQSSNNSNSNSHLSINNHSTMKKQSILQNRKSQNQISSNHQISSSLSQHKQSKSQKKLMNSSQKKVGLISGQVNNFLNNNQTKNQDQAFYSQTPLSDHKVIMDKTFKLAFKAYLLGELSDEEIMYVKNFPHMFQNLPEPKIQYLKMLFQPMEEEEKQSTYNSDKEYDSEKDDYYNDNDYNDKLQQAKKDHVRQSSKLSSKNSICRKSFYPQHVKVQVESPKQKVFIYPQDFHIRNSRTSFLAKSKLTSFKDIEPPSTAPVYHAKKSVGFLDKDDSKKSFAILKQTIQSQKNHKKQKNTIEKSLKQLRKQIQSNIEFRKETNQSKPKQVGGGLLGTIGAQAQNANKNHTTEKDMNAYKQKFISKNFQNLSIVHEKRENNHEALNERSNGMIEDFHTLRPLYQKFFNENANQYLQTLKEPYNKQYRQLIQHSDQEFDKHVQNYFNKRQIAKEKEEAREKNQTLSKLKTYIDGGICEFGFKKWVPAKEKIYISQLGDLNSYKPDHMIKSLVKFDRNQDQEMPVEKRRPQKIQMIRGVLPEDNKIKKHKQNKSVNISSIQDNTFYQKGSFNNKSGYKKRKSEVITEHNTQSHIQQSQVHSALQTPGNVTQGNVNVTSITNNQENINKLEVNPNALQSIQQQNLEYKKKIDSQKKRGYFMIKRNQSVKTLNNAQKDGFLRDASDESSQASMTEGQLENLYTSSINLQNKLASNKENNLIRKLKQLIELEDLKKDVYEANAYKLEHR